MFIISIMNIPYDPILHSMKAALLALKPLAPLLVGLVCLRLGRFFYRRNKAAIKGTLGEALVNQLTFRKLDAQLYRGFSDVYLPRADGDGTTQVDHVVVSPFGIFVIETKNYAGWIYGAEHQARWTQTFSRFRKHAFQNPIWQNKAHIRALAEFLHLPEAVFHNVVFFCGECTFKTAMPEDVINTSLSGCIKRKQERLLQPEQVAAANEALAGLVAQTDKRQVKREHIAGIKRRVAARA